MGTAYQRVQRLTAKVFCCRSNLTGYTLGISRSKSRKPASSPVVDALMEINSTTVTTRFLLETEQISELNKATSSKP
jgi:hypothetical protein